MAQRDTPRLNETRAISREGRYFLNGVEIILPRSPAQIPVVRYYAAAEAAQIPLTPVAESTTMGLVLRDQGALEAAHTLWERDAEPVLILNFANPRRPGGGIRENPGTQEEHLCMKTTLLASLESEAARLFYEENKASHTQAQTDAILLSPHTVVFRNSDLSLMAEPFPVAVMTVSAPIASRMQPEELPRLEAILLCRIRAMIRCAMAEGYRRLVLGAWGCGNFRNDPDLVARLFAQVLTEEFGSDNRCCAARFFTDVVMAVPDRSSRCYRSFANYFKEEV